MIEARDLTKSYRNHHVLKAVSFSLAKGKILGVFGSNGAGKTTLLKILSLLFKPEKGTLQVNGIDAVSRPQDIRPMIGYVPQEIALYQDLSAADNLFCWSKGGKLALDDLQQSETIQALDIGSLLKKKVRRLSGGMKRRVNLAVALMNDPQILIMDEPLVGVDIIQRQLILDHLKTLSQRGVTQVITSHYPAELITFVDEVMLLDAGEMKLHQSSDVLQTMGRNQNIQLDRYIRELIQR